MRRLIWLLAVRTCQFVPSAGYRLTSHYKLIVLCLIVSEIHSFANFDKIASENDQKMPQSQTAKHPMAPLGRDTKHRQSDQGLHCLLTECYIKIWIKIKNANKNPLKWKWTGPIESSWEISFGLIGLKGTATLTITMFYMKDLNKPWISIPDSS